MPDKPRKRRPAAPGGRPIRVGVQLSIEEYEALQRISETQAMGIPQVLADAALDSQRINPRAVLNELAGVRRIVTDEHVQLRLIADNAAKDQWDQEVWNEAAKGIAWRNEKLTERYGW